MSHFSAQVVFFVDLQVLRRMVGDNHFRYQAWTNLSSACWTARVELFQAQN